MSSPVWFRQYIVTGASTNRQRIWKGLGALLVSALLWFMLILDREYETVFVCPVKITHVPADVHFTKAVQREARISVEGNGIMLLKRHLAFQRDTVALNFLNQHGTPENAFLLTKDALPDVRRGMTKGIMPTRVLPESIPLSFEHRTSPSPDAQEDSDFPQVQSVIRVPIRILHVPPRTSVRLNHTEISLSCVTPAPKADALRSSITEITIEYSELDSTQSSLVPAVNLPDYARLVSREPFEIGYTILRE